MTQPSALARDWATRIIKSADIDAMRDSVSNAQRATDDYDDGVSFARSDEIEWADGIGILREATNHYPHPVAGLLFDACLERLPYGATRYEDGIDNGDLEDLVITVLENPNALLD